MAHWVAWPCRGENNLKNLKPLPGPYKLAIFGAVRTKVYQRCAISTNAYASLVGPVAVVGCVEAIACFLVLAAFPGPYYQQHFRITTRCEDFLATCLLNVTDLTERPSPMLSKNQKHKASDSERSKLYTGRLCICS